MENMQFINFMYLSIDWPINNWLFYQIIYINIFTPSIYYNLLYVYIIIFLQFDIVIVSRNTNNNDLLLNLKYYKINCL